MRRSLFGLLILITLAGTSACQGAAGPPAPTVAPTATPPISAYATRTPSPPPPAAQAPRRTATPPPPPTPTPFLHTIVKDDTLLGVALRYGVSLEALLAANPGIDPGFLTIGMTVTIPLSDTLPVIPSPTPLAIQVQAPACYSLGDGGAGCFLLVQNEQEAAVESLAVQLDLLDAGGQALASQALTAPLNLLPGGRSMPMWAAFDLPLSQVAQAEARLVSALPVESAAGRYLALQASASPQISPDGRSARLEGALSLAEGEPAAAQVWLLAFAADRDGRIVAMRRWESADLAPGQVLPFTIQLYSLGAPIAAVDWLAEARP
jgi:LysM repeat protein